MKKILSILVVFVLFFSIVSCDETPFQKKYSIVLDGNDGKEKMKLTTYDNVFEEGSGEITLVDKDGKEYAASYVTKIVYPSCDCAECRDEEELETKLYIRLAWTKNQSYTDHLNGITPTRGFKETSYDVCYVYDKDIRRFIVR